MGPVHLIRICELEHQQKDFVVLFLACLLRQDVLRLAQRRQACRTELHDSRGLGPEVGILRRYTSMEIYIYIFFKFSRLHGLYGKRANDTDIRSQSHGLPNWRATPTRAPLTRPQIYTEFYTSEFGPPCLDHGPLPHLPQPCRTRRGAAYARTGTGTGSRATGGIARERSTGTRDRRSGARRHGKHGKGRLLRLLWQLQVPARGRARRGRVIVARARQDAAEVTDARGRRRGESRWRRRRRVHRRVRRPRGLQRRWRLKPPRAHAHARTRARRRGCVATMRT